MAPRQRFSRRVAVVAAALALFFLYQVFTLHSHLQQPRISTSSSLETSTENVSGEPTPYCPPLPGIEDILVVMKTGVTEARDKVPIHFSTTLRCIPHYVIYSDFDEEIEGVQIHDVLKHMDPEVTNQVPDFDIYNRIARGGRKGLEQHDFADVANSNTGKPNNPGWKLDKWKFLPMAQEALKQKPKAKWFVFMEADTFISWPTLLAWLDKFDHKKPFYIGTETQIGDVIFAHGGSGFILSNPALSKASKEYEKRRNELDHYTNAHWAGDCVLGKVLADAGVNLHFSWPILQNSNLGELDEFITDLYREPWCYIAVALHHLSSKDIEGLWKYEQKRWNDVSLVFLTRLPTTLQITNPDKISQKNKRILLHSDLFRDYIYPQMVTQPIRQTWDNLSGDEQPFAKTVDDCRETCDVEKSCVQFSFRDGKCFTGPHPRLGNPSPLSDLAVSGWMPARIKKMVEEKGFCRGAEFGNF